MNNEMSKKKKKVDIKCEHLSVEMEEIRQKFEKF